MAPGCIVLAVPRGEYAIIDHSGRQVGSETFTSAPGPMGWRYYATVQRFGPEPRTERLDVSVDAHGRPVRIRIETRDHSALLVVRGGTLEGMRDAEPVSVPWSAGVGVEYASPGFFAVALHRLGSTTERDVIVLDQDTLEPRRSKRRFELVREGPVTSKAGIFDARTWLLGGRTVSISGNVLVADDGPFQLIAYEPGESGPWPRLRPV